MAIEDEIINITDIDVGTEILNNDKLIIETNNGTKLIAFKDLVIGEDNITFKSKLVQGAAATGASTTTTSVVTGYNILTSDTTAGHVTKYSDISGTVELGKFNYNGIATFAALSSIISQNESEISHLKAQLDLVRTTFSSSSALSSTQLTLSAVNFDFQSGSTPKPTGSFTAQQRGGHIQFTSDSIIVDPTKTNKNVAYNLLPFSITYPNDSSYIGGYVLFDLSVRCRKNYNPVLTIYKTTDAGATTAVWGESMGPTVAGSPVMSWQNSRHASHQAILRINPGDKITVTSSKALTHVSLKGFKL
tara:strand:+ start:1653 stop:2564 length:912 start_codon:yes stop_codon:yes gene_type:complete